MIALFVIFTCLFFATSVIGWSSAYVEKHQRDVEVTALKKVGGWYEGRVTELEQETRNLAAQIVASGGVRIAMPHPEPEAYHEYAYDDTGLVRETLDARDLPVT